MIMIYVGGRIWHIMRPLVSRVIGPSGHGDTTVNGNEAESNPAPPDDAQTAANEDTNNTNTIFSNLASYLFGGASTLFTPSLGGCH